MGELAFDLADIAARTGALAQRLRTCLEASAHADIRALCADIPSREESVLSVALVGAYDAGKSTIVSALTGRSDIIIGSDVSTNAVTSYRWNGIDLCDTPGIHAGRADHDALTHGEIDRVDLVLFVVSNELFDHQLAAHFRRLILDGARAAQTMLVVNKMSQDPGSAADKLPDLARVMAPLTTDELRAVFIDARCAYDSRGAEEPDRSELLELAGWAGFLGALNRFVRERGHLGRLAQPLHALASATAAAEGRLASEGNGTDGMRLELLHRKETILVELERRLRGDMTSLIEKACGDIITMGDRLAEAAEADADPKAFERLGQETAARAAARTDDLVRDAEALFDVVHADLDRRIAALAETPLALQLGDLGNIEASFGGAPDITASTTAFKDAGGYAKGAKSTATWLEKLARGPRAAASEASSAAAAGSKLHESVKVVGTFFGHKFKPWEAVNIAKSIGNVARVVGVVAGLAGPVLQVLDERHADKVARELKEARSSIRSAYRAAGSDVSAQLRAHLEQAIDASFTRELSGVRDEHDRIVQARDDRSAEARSLAELRAEGRELLERLADASRTSEA